MSGIYSCSFVRNSGFEQQLAADSQLYESLCQIQVLTHSVGQNARISARCVLLRCVGRSQSHFTYSGGVTVQDIPYSPISALQAEDTVCAIVQPRCLKAQQQGQNYYKSEEKQPCSLVIEPKGHPPPPNQHERIKGPTGRSKVMRPTKHEHSYFKCFFPQTKTRLSKNQRCHATLTQEAFCQRCRLLYLNPKQGKCETTRREEFQVRDVINEHLTVLFTCQSLRTLQVHMLSRIIVHNHYHGGRNLTTASIKITPVLHA